MFEKIKEKGKKVKQWAVEHKTDLAYFGGVIVGTVVTMVVYSHEDKKELQKSIIRYPHEAQVLSMEKHSEGKYCATGESPLTVDGLSKDMAALGIPGDSKVIGALVYTKK